MPALNFAGRQAKPLLVHAVGKLRHQMLVPITHHTRNGVDNDLQLPLPNREVAGPIIDLLTQLRLVALDFDFKLFSGGDVGADCAIFLWHAG